MAKKPVFEVDIQIMVYGGDGMGRLPDGRAVFVPGVLPGERVRVRLVEEKKAYARAQLLNVLTPSPDRVVTGSGSAGACPGCHYLYMTYEAQLRAKTDIVRDQLQRIAGIPEPPVAPIIRSPLEWHYRNTVQFHLTPDGKLGFQEPGTHTVVPVEECLLCDPAIEELLPQLDIDAMSGIERIRLRVGSGDEILMVLESQNPVPPDLTVDLPISVVFVGPGGFEENEPLVLAGDSYQIMEARGRAFRVSAGSFFQVNTQQAENMIDYLLNHLPLSPETTLLEVYAGVGMFSAFLAPRVGRLTAVEASPSAVEDFAANLDEFDHVELYEGLAEEILPGLEIKPDVVLVDPPRAGLDQRALGALINMEAPLLAYVSCDPATLARDIKRLLAAGYVVQSVQPFDMFPQTYHVECVTLMCASS